MNCVTRAPILLLRSWVALSFKVCEWGSNYESLLSFRAARTTKNEKKSSLTDFSDLHLKAAPHCKASAGTWLPGWMCSWQWFVTMFHDNGSWQLFVTMVGDNGSWQGLVTLVRDNGWWSYNLDDVDFEGTKSEIRCEQIAHQSSPVTWCPGSSTRWGSWPGLTGRRKSKREWGDTCRKL